jgi:uncharacterized protein (TIGR00251 family)
MIPLTQQPDGVRFALKVVPGASRDRIVGVLGDALKVAVSKPPADGAANKAVVTLLAKALGVRMHNVSVVRGHGSPRKEVRITGLSLAELSNRLSDFTDV